MISTDPNMIEHRRSLLTRLLWRLFGAKTEELPRSAPDTDAKTPKDETIRTLLARGDAARDRCDWAEAERFYRDYLALAPEDFAIRVQAGHAAKEAGRLDAAWDAYAQAATIRRDDADLRTHRAHLALRTKRFADARVLFDEILAQSSEDPEARAARAIAEIGLRHPDAPEYRRNAIHSRDAGDWRRAATYYRRYLEVIDDDADAFVQAGHAEKESGRFAAAEQYYKKAFEIEPGNADIALQLGHLARLRATPEEAARWYKEALALNAACTDATQALAELGLMARRMRSAERPLLEEGSSPTAAPPINVARAILEDGKAFAAAVRDAELSGDLPRAAALVRWRVRQAPNDTTLWRKLANLFDKMQRSEDANRARRVTEAIEHTASYSKTGKKANETAASATQLLAARRRS